MGRERRLHPTLSHRCPVKRTHIFSALVIVIPIRLAQFDRIYDEVELSDRALCALHGRTRCTEGKEPVTIQSIGMS